MPVQFLEKSMRVSPSRILFGNHRSVNVDALSNPNQFYQMLARLARLSECGDLSPLWISNGSEQIENLPPIQTWSKPKAVTGPRTPKDSDLVGNCASGYKP